MKKLNLNTTLFFLMLFFCSISSVNIAYGQTIINGPVVSLEPCQEYSYNTDFTVPSGATSVKYDWLVSSNFEKITPIGNGADARITWKDAPDSTTPKVVKCSISFLAKDAKSRTTIDATPRDITVKYISPPGAISLNGNTQNPYHLACGTTPVTLSINGLYTEPTANVVYNWYLPSGWSINGASNSNSITVIPTAGTGGSISLNVRRSDGTCIKTTSIFITRPAVNLSYTGMTRICVGSSESYNLLGAPGGSTITWTASNNLSPQSGTSALATVSGISDGDAWIEYKVVSICGTFTKKVYLAVGGHDKQITGLMTQMGVSPGEILELTAPIGSNYSWSVQGGYIVGNSASQTVTVAVEQCYPEMVNGYFNVQVSYTDVCGIAVSHGEATYIVCGTGGGANAYTVSPNPGKDKVKITGQKKGSSIQEIQLFDKFGNLKKTEKYNQFNSSVEINTSEFIPGTYYVRIFDGEIWETKRLSILR